MTSTVTTPAGATDGLVATPCERVSGVRRIAVLRANAVGDFVLALPAMAALRAAYPQSRITVLGAAWHRPFLTGRDGPWDDALVVPAVAGIRSDAPPAPDAEVARFCQEQRAEGYDLAVQLHGGGANSNGFLTALGAKVTVGSRALDAPPLDRWVRYTLWQHEVLRFLEVVRLVGAPLVTLEPSLSLTAADREEAAPVLAAAGLHADSPYAALHVGAMDARRRWPPGHFAAVADALGERGLQVVLVGAADEGELVGRVALATRRPVVDLCGQLSLGGTLAVLAGSSVVVANDSGPRHLAAAVGVPTVGVFWAGNLVNTGPLTRSRHRVCVSFRTACPTCGNDQSVGRCTHDPSFVADVSVEEVVEAAVDLLDAHVVS